MRKRLNIPFSAPRTLYPFSIPPHPYMDIYFVLSLSAIFLPGRVFGIAIAPGIVCPVPENAVQISATEELNPFPLKSRLKNLASVWRNTIRILISFVLLTLSVSRLVCIQNASLCSAERQWKITEIRESIRHLHSGAFL